MMARGQKTKQKELTSEERMQNALVPKEDWPYELPEGWRWVYLIPGAANCLDGLRKPVNASERATRVGNIPYYGATGQVGYIDDYLTDEQLVLVGEDGAPFLDPFKDKAYMINGKAWVNNHAHILRSYFGDAGNRFLMHYLNAFDYRGFVNGTTRLKLTQSSMQTIPVPYPSKEIQKKIADFIDREFHKLDEAKDQIQSVLDSSEARKQSILHKAFTGELTEKWRKENKHKNTWTYKTLEEVCSSIFDGDHMPPPKSDSGIPFIVISNINNRKLSLDDTRYVPPEYYENLTETRKPHKGDVLYTLVGSYGIPVIVDTDQPFCFQRHMALLKPSAIDTRFLWYALQTNRVYQEASEIATGTAQLTVPIKGLRKIIIPLCDMEEQHEVVRILDRYYQEEDQVSYKEQDVDKTIDDMKKSILSKAFRGELHL